MSIIDAISHGLDQIQIIALSDTTNPLDFIVKLVALAIISLILLRLTHVARKLWQYRKDEKVLTESTATLNELKKKEKEEVIEKVLENSPIELQKLDMSKVQRQQVSLALVETEERIRRSQLYFMAFIGVLIVVVTALYFNHMESGVKQLPKLISQIDSDGLDDKDKKIIKKVLAEKGYILITQQAFNDKNHKKSLEQTLKNYHYYNVYDIDLVQEMVKEASIKAENFEKNKTETYEKGSSYYDEIHSIKKLRTLASKREIPFEPLGVKMEATVPDLKQQPPVFTVRVSNNSDYANRILQIFDMNEKRKIEVLGRPDNNLKENQIHMKHEQLTYLNGTYPKEGKLNVVVKDIINTEGIPIYLTDYTCDFIDKLKNKYDKENARDRMLCKKGEKNSVIVLEELQSLL